MRHLAAFVIITISVLSCQFLETVDITAPFIFWIIGVVTGYIFRLIGSYN